MITYKVSGYVSGAEQLREALSSTLVISGARLSELVDGLPHLRIEPRVGNGLEVAEISATVAGYTGVNVSQLAVKIQTGGGLAFNGNGELYSTVAGGAGDVLGPASATDNAIVRFDATTGKLIQNSVVTIDDTGSMEGVTQIDFDTLDTAAAAGRLRWDSTDGTLKLILSGGTTDVRLGQEEVQRVLNVTGATLLKGKVVRIVGAQGNRKTVALAQANTEATSAVTFGVLAENIANNASGYVMVSGYVRDIDTSAFAEGAILWLSETTAGTITTTRPAAPNHGVQVGFCVKQHASSGIIYVAVQNGYELDELHNVTIISPVAGHMLRYSGTIWENVASPNLVTGSSYQIDGVSVLSASTLGAGVTNSSLTSLGTLTSLTVGTVTYAAPAAESAADLTRLGGNLRVGGTIYATDFVLSGGTGGSPGIGISLDNLDDVTITGTGAALSGHYLRHNGSAWVNAPIPTGDLGSGTANSTTFLRGDRTWAVASLVGVLDDLTDVTITTPGANHILAYVGSQWVNTATPTMTSVGIGGVGVVSSGTLTTTATTANQLVLALSATTYRSIKYVLQVVSGAAYQVSELLVVHDGTTAYLTEYAIVQSGTSLATFNVDISGGNLRLLTTPTNAATTIKVIATAVTV